MIPKVVKRRVHALKRLQVQCANIEAKFYEEVHELERKYAALYHPLFEKVVSKRSSTLSVIKTCHFLARIRLILAFSVFCFMSLLTFSGLLG